MTEEKTMELTAYERWVDAKLEKMKKLESENKELRNSLSSCIEAHAALESENEGLRAALEECLAHYGKPHEMPKVLKWRKALSGSYEVKK